MLLCDPALLFVHAGHKWVQLDEWGIYLAEQGPCHGTAALGSLLVYKLTACKALHTSQNLEGLPTQPALQHENITQNSLYSNGRLSACQ